MNLTSSIYSSGEKQILDHITLNNIPYQFKNKILPNILGIDIGESLTKIANYKNDNLHLQLYSTKKEKDEFQDILTSNSTQSDAVHFTGGKSFELYSKLKNDSEVKLISEFEANAKGTHLLYELEKDEVLKSSLVVTIGTGTSVVLTGKKIEHLGGSALGGAVFMGILRLLFNDFDYNSAVTIAVEGNRYNIDLKVGDIYHPDDNRVEPLFREFTAASFGKITDSFDIESMKKEDLINSLICLIAENIGTLSIKMAELQKIENIVYCGGFLKENEVLKSLLRVLCLVNRKNPIFLNYSEYAGAIGVISR